jgi:hypothetical protein
MTQWRSCSHAGGHFLEGREALSRLGRVVGTDTTYRHARIEREISDTGFVVLVAEAGGEIVGFAMAVPARHDLRVLYVKPNPIGRVGQTLLAELETLVFETTEFLVCDASLNAAGFYAANGYVEECWKDHVSIPDGVVSRVVQMKKHRPRAQADFAWPCSAARPHPTLPRLAGEGSFSPSHSWERAQGEGASVARSTNICLVLRYPGAPSIVRIVPVV